MTEMGTSRTPKGLARMLAWRRLKPPLIACAVLFLMMAPGWQVSYAVLIFRLLFIALVAVLAFGILERWPARLPSWVARWVLQVVAVAVVMPFAAAIAYALTTMSDP